MAAIVRNTLKASTAIVIASCDEVPHLEVVASWEQPSEAGSGWAVPIGDVEAVICDSCRRYYVREIACGPFRWARTLQALDEEGCRWWSFRSRLRG